jgi:hypothetical protein
MRPVPTSNGRGTRRRGSPPSSARCHSQPKPVARPQPVTPNRLHPVTQIRPDPRDLQVRRCNLGRNPRRRIDPSSRIADGRQQSQPRPRSLPNRCRFLVGSHQRIRPSPVALEAQDDHVSIIGSRHRDLREVEASQTSFRAGPNSNDNSCAEPVAPSSKTVPTPSPSLRSFAL